MRKSTSSFCSIDSAGVARQTNLQTLNYHPLLHHSLAVLYHIAAGLQTLSVTKYTTPYKEIMPLSNRRRARRKEIQLQETSDAEAPDSSPSRPSNKKRKVSDAVAQGD